MALFNRNRFRALVSAFMLSAVLAGCGNGGGDGLPGTTFRSGNITADSPELTALTADPNTAANRVNIAGNIVDVVDDGDDATTDTPALSFTVSINAGGNPAAPTDDDTTADVDESEETDAEELARFDSLWIVSGGVVNNILDSADAPTPADQTAGNLHIQNFEVITIDGGTVNGDVDTSAATAAVTFDLRSGIVGPTTGATADTIAITGSGQDDVFIIAGDRTGDSPTLDINGAINGAVGTDEVQFNAGAIVSIVDFGGFDPSGAGVILRNVETITLNGGTINTRIDASQAPAGADNVTGITFNLRSGTIGSNLDTDGVGGSLRNDIFNLGSGITIDGVLVGNDGADIFNLEGGTITGGVRGGGGVDSFVIGAGITISGTIDGGADADTLSLATGFTPTAANLFGGVLTLTLNGGGSLALTLANIATENIDVGTLTLTTMRLPGGGDPMTPTTLTFTGTAEADTFAITTDITDPTQRQLESVIDGLDGADVLELNTGAVVRNIAFSSNAPTGGDVHLQSVETITLNGGRVTGNITGPATATTFNLMSGTVGGNITGGAGVDTFTLSGGTVTGDVLGGAGNDLFSVTGAVEADLAGDGGDDSFTLDAALTGSIAGGGDDDWIRLNPGASVSGMISGDGGADTFMLTGGTVGGNIDGGAGNDMFTWSGGTVTGYIDGGTGADTFRANTAVNVRVTTDDTDTTANAIRLRNVENITLSGANDTLILLSGSVTGNIAMGGGNDELTVTDGVTYGATVIIGGVGGIDRFVWGTGLTTSGVTHVIGPTFEFAGRDPGPDETHDGTNTVPRPINFEVFVLDGGTIGGYTGWEFVDRLELLSGSVTGNIAMGDGDDQLTVTGGVSFTGTIDGGADTDRFVWGAGLTTTGVTATSTTFTFAGTNHGGTGNTVPDPTNFEVFVIDGGTIGTFTGGSGSDTLELLSGMVTMNISTAGGNDTITLSGGTMTGNVEGGGENDTITLLGGTVTGNLNGSGGNDTITLSGGSLNGNVNGNAGDDTFIVSGNTVGANPALDINGLIQGGDNTDEVRVVGGGGVVTIDFGNVTAGELNLRDIETITINGGTVVSISAASAFAATAGTDPVTATGITFNLISGRIGTAANFSAVNGSHRSDTFNLHGGITIIGSLNGSGFNTAGETINDNDVLRYAGAPATGTVFAGCGGIGADTDISDSSTGPVFNIESQGDLSGGGACNTPNSNAVGASLRSLTVRGIEVLELAPALNLYGALSDALMQFGAQTAQGFALADLNLATGRGTQLVSKNSPFTKGRIWAHKITHSGNGKGSIGLNLTGLTARADSDYDYEMSLTQHGFDAPVATTRLGAFNLRAVSHTMTGVIETNVAEANVSGYGAGVALLWNSGAAASKASASATRVSAHHHGLSAHITSLAGAYEVEAHTSPLNPRAVVNEVSEGSFSAINAVVSAGVADTRKLGHSLVLRTTADLVWQTLSLDDFSETGSGGIAINFDKATRFTARVGAGLESEHWFSDVVFVHETSSGGTLSSGLSQDYRQDDGTAIEMKFGGKIADLATGLTLKAYAGLRTSLITSDSIDPSAHLALNWRF